VITDTISGSKISRKGLDALMKAVRGGKVDVVLCYNLDRLGRSLSHLVQLLAEFAAHKVALIVPGQGINMSSSNPASALLLNMLGAIAQFEHSTIDERVNAGLAAARRRGVKLGRPKLSVFIARPWPNCARKDAQDAPSPKNSGSQAQAFSNSSPDSKLESGYSVPP